VRPAGNNSVAPIDALVVRPSRYRADGRVPLSAEAIQIREVCRRHVRATYSPGHDEVVQRWGKRVAREIEFNGRVRACRDGRPFRTPLQLLGHCDAAILELVRAGEAVLVGFSYERPPVPGRKQYLVLAEDVPPNYKPIKYL
jgi:hypothetical protein